MILSRKNQKEHAKLGIKTLSLMSFNVLVSVTVKSIISSVYIQNVIMLSVVMQYVVMQNVVAPFVNLIFCLPTQNCFYGGGMRIGDN
jgi:hypothetical protein